MKRTSIIKTYSPFEEKLNVFSHAIGLVLSVVALLFLILKAMKSGNPIVIVSFVVFGLSLITLYAASTFYHNAKNPVLRQRLKIFDHASIFVLIAGTYTPFTLITLHGTIGLTIFSVSWAIALFGIILKFFFIGKYKIASTIMYVMMGWIIVFAINPLIKNLPASGLNWLISGGIAYTIGALLYNIKQIKLNHAIFHVFVLAGSLCHFISIYFYVIA